MGFGIFALLAALAVAIFGLFGRYALDAGKEQKYGQMWGAVFFAVLPVEAVLLLLAPVDQSAMIPKLIALAICGAILGAAASLWAGYRLMGSPQPGATTSQAEVKNSSKRSAAELLALHAGRSGLEATKLLEPFKGLWIPPFDGTIGVMSPDGDSGAMIVVREGSDALECHFQEQWVRELYQYKQGDLIRVTGAVSHYTGPNLLVLTRCEIAK
jgi:hypothetical protein